MHARSRTAHAMPPRARERPVRRHGRLHGRRNDEPPLKYTHPAHVTFFHCVASQCTVTAPDRASSLVAYVSDPGIMHHVHVHIPCPCTRPSGGVVVPLRMSGCCLLSLVVALVVPCSRPCPARPLASPLACLRAQRELVAPRACAMQTPRPSPHHPGYGIVSAPRSMLSMHLAP